MYIVEISQIAIKRYHYQRIEPMYDENQCQLWVDNRVLYVYKLKILLKILDNILK